MATTTPNFGWSVPTSSDLVKNGATAIETLGDSIDASMGELLGGTTGQVLAKTSNTSMDFTWTTPSGGSANTAGKNGVLNSGFNVWQRGTSAAGSTTAFSADRWQSYRAVAGSTYSRQATGDTTNLPFIQYCMRMQRDLANTATNNIFLWQNFETVNSVPFAGKTVTFSFYARKGANYSATSDALAYQVYTGTGTDQNQLAGYTGQATPISATATLTTTWQRFSTSATIAATATELNTQFYYTPTGVAGAADYVEITGVQLEIASSASAYSPATPTYQAELQACRRYLPAYKVDEIIGYAYSTNNGLWGIQFDTPARVTPTGITTSGAFNGWALNVSSSVTPAFNTACVNNGSVTAGFTITAGQGSRLGSGGLILFTGCEL
jgi:hypothetical protein